MSVKTNRKPNTSAAASSADEPELTAVDPTTDEESGEQTQQPQPKKKGRFGPKGPALNFSKPRQVALGLLMRRIASGKIPGPLTTPVVSAYITGAKSLPEGHDDLAEHLASFKGVEDLVTGAKLTAARNKVHDILVTAGKTGLPEFERTRTMVDPDAFDDLE